MLFAMPDLFFYQGNLGTMMDPSSSMLNTLYNVLNGEIAQSFQYSGPFYSQVSENYSCSCN